MSDFADVRITDSELLSNAEAIAEFLRRLGLADMTTRKVYQWVKAGKLPARKVGAHIIASTRAIRAHFGLEGCP